jgi:pimeloyl-ACP methyl ester carboxylesterase
MSATTLRLAKGGQMRLRTRGSRGITAALAASTIIGSCALLSSSAATARPAPAGLPSFYSVPVVKHKAPGTLIKSEVVPAAGVEGTTYLVMYVSTNERGASKAVTGLIFVPPTPAPAGGYPVVTWAHGTNGMANQCAPSLDPADALPSVAILNQLLGEGWEVTASDYQGEGTPPGLLPYLVGDLSARNTIDIVRAARELPAADAGSNYLVWGHSEGGQTAMFAWELGPTYGSQSGLHLVGVVAGAPPSQFAYIYDALQSSPYRFYLFMAAAGFHSAYGAKLAPLGEVLTPKAMRLLPVLRQGCFDYLQSTLDQYSLTQLVKVNPFDVPAWNTLLQENDPENFSANAVPLLIIQGGADEQIPVASTQLLAAHLCGLGQDLERWIYPGLSHTGVIPVSANDMVQWMADRFAGDSDPDPYVPVGEAGVQTTTCP